MCERITMPDGTTVIVCGRNHRRTNMAMRKLKAQEGGEGGNFELAPALDHIACLVAIVDLGTQEYVYNGTPTQAKKVYLGWELLGLRQEKGDRKGEPFLLGEEYTQSMSSNSHLRALIEGWLGRTFKEGEDYNPWCPVEGKPWERAAPGGLLGRYCLLDVEHRTSKAKKRQFACIKNVSGIPRAMHPAAEKLRPTIAPFLWEIETPDVPLFCDNVFLMGKKLSDHIAAAVERRGKHDRAPAGQRAPVVQGYAPVSTANGADEDAF